ncbi:FAD/NAD(P)-binding protein [Tessaracoccus antarcticus]|nr:FAD/NAD(P)-binding protein [Tessaracoccus antarcticus]
MGPRGASLMERIAARPGSVADVHMVDDHAPGAGRIWRTDQDRDMCMNTLAGAVTLFTDASFSGVGPVVEGPSFHEWCQLVAEFADGERADVAAARRSYFEAGADVSAVLADRGFRAEVRRTGPGSHPSRALYGFYCDWVLRTSLRRLGPAVHVTRHTTRATAIRAAGPRRTLVELADGTTLAADAVALAPGWLPSEPGPADRALAAATTGRDVSWVLPESPIHQDLTGIRAGEDVIVRGLGMGFFDSLSMLTIGRGGRFDEAPGNRLRYIASGEEPVVHVGSRRGLPFLAKSVYQGLPPAATLRRVRAAEARGLSTPLRFADEVWPHLVRDANEAFYTTLARRLPLDLAAIGAAIDADDLATLPERVRPLLPEGVNPFDLQALLTHRIAPCSTQEYQRIIRDAVGVDLDEADAGLASPLKAALWEVNGARRWSIERAAFDGSDTEGYDGDLAEFLGFGGMIGSGPPAFRARQLLALIDAGLVRFIGPGVQVGLDGRVFTAHSPIVAGSGVTARVLLDAWVRLHDARHTTDPLLQQLMADKLAEPFGRRNAAGGRTPGPGLRIDEVSSELIGPGGRHGIHLLGVPSDVARGDTIIAPMPGTDPTMLRELDACVEAMLPGGGRATGQAIGRHAAQRALTA